MYRGGTIIITPSIYVTIGRSTKIVLRFLFVLNFCYWPKNFPVHCTNPNKGHCMVSWLNTASPSQCHLSIHRRLEQVSPMYRIEWGGPRHTSQVGCIFLPSLNPVKWWLHRTGKKGRPALKVSWSIFGNTEMYHLCVHYISSRTREESALVPVLPLDGGRGRIMDPLPCR